MKVLVSAYACEPGKGSEPGVGWQWVRQIARFHDTWVITRANNREKIEADLLQRPGSVDRHRFTFDDTGASDQEDRPVITNLEVAELHASATLGNEPS